MKQMIKEYWFWIIVAMTFCLIIATIEIGVQRTQISRLRQQVEFESLKEGLCVYIEYDPWQGYSYCLVYDYDIEKVIEVDLYDELIHTDISVGDTIVYIVDYDYTDADFLNVIKQN